MNTKFIIGMWYRCACNKILYRYGGVNPSDPQRAIFTGRINPTHKSILGIPPRTYIDGKTDQSLLEYFNPKDKADLAVVSKYAGSFQPKTIKPMKAVKQVTTKIKGVERDLTVVAIINDGQVRVGYAVRNPEDKDNKELSEKIATGRALADRTNLADMTVGIGMDKKYILYAIAEHFVRQIERGSIEVKGIKN